MNNRDVTVQAAIDALLQTEEWERMWEKESELTKANRALGDVLSEVENCLSKELMNDLWQAICECEYEIQHASVLYGFHIAYAMHSKAADLWAGQQG